jgi:hypothetical protein
VGIELRVHERGLAGARDSDEAHAAPATRPDRAALVKPADRVREMLREVFGGGEGCERASRTSHARFVVHCAPIFCHAPSTGAERTKSLDTDRGKKPFRMYRECMTGLNAHVQRALDVYVVAASVARARYASPCANVLRLADVNQANSGMHL